MNKESLHRILQSVATGKTSVDNAAKALTNISFENIDFAHIDHNRSLRKGFPEVVFGEGKTAEQIIRIVEKIHKEEDLVLVTRVSQNKAETIKSHLSDIEYHQDAKMLIFKKNEISLQGKGKILVLSAGTSDIPVAKEAYLTARSMGNQVESIFDVGVAGIHRLFNYQKEISEAQVLIVVAGMEGALPSVVAGMVSRPVIAVPTSVGYGVSLGGLTALFAMLNSCSSNVAVVNIDNGFGAGYFASVINRK
ncbi:MAG: nickel pincer cofactor biosynthesis protein LarB [Desulfobacterales bacterium]|nr:nickel pincer cofactor biosynthesis protein LarB [Deltaproteobacteria bacterium]NNL41939.1 nickel pincer cofactor biosynthesis protein LarB [Desulfobacterales bacterium]